LSDVVTKDDTVSMERFSVVKLGFMALRSTLWRDPDFARHGRNSLIFQHAKQLFACLVEVLNEYSHDHVTSDEIMSPWPPRVFAASNGLVEDYFGEGISLPLNWKTLLRAENLKPRLDDLCSLLNGTLAEVIYALLSDAPFVELQESDDLLEQRKYKEGLHHALLHREDQVQCEEPCVYLPRSMVGKLLDATAERFDYVVVSEREQEEASGAQLPEVHDSADDDFIGPIDLPPTDDGDEHNSTLGDSQRKAVVRSSEAFDGSKSDTDAIESAEADRSSEQPTSAAEVEEQDEPCVFPPVSSCTKRQHSQDRPSAKGARSGRRGASPARKRPRSVRDSRAFTRRLRELASGDTVDMMVGSVPLSVLLGDVPDLVDDIAARSTPRK
jgi:hypothetical protein